MPASEIMDDFKKGTLHSGPGGPKVTNPKQATAIKMSYLRKEGKQIPASSSGKKARKIGGKIGSPKSV
jgi:Family of unknown function (DUF6496)